MKEHFNNADGGIILTRLIDCIRDNVEYLSKLDGQIADGDHGVNMKKGFELFTRKLGDRILSLSEAMGILGNVLMSEIGGSMGPIYGSFFLEMADVCYKENEINKETLLNMYRMALESIQLLGAAKAGDKTMIDTLIPAVKALEKSIFQGDHFPQCLEKMKQAAEKGMNSTEGMIAKVGRSARIGERSRGVLDAGAVSCNLIIQSMSDSMITLLN